MESWKSDMTKVMIDYDVDPHCGTLFEAEGSGRTLGEIPERQDGTPLDPLAHPHCER